MAVRPAGLDARMDAVIRAFGSRRGSDDATPHAKVEPDELDLCYITPRLLGAFLLRRRPNSLLVVVDAFP